MSGHYKKPAEAGKLFPCKKCGKTATAGQDRYFEKIEVPGPDGSKTEVWIGCIDFECFKSQGGSATPAEQKKMFQSTKFKLEQAKPLMEMTEGFLKEFEEKHNKTRTGSDTGMLVNEKAVFIESIFRTLSQNFKS